MASVYGYCTEALVESRSGIDYSAKLAKYSSTVVEAVISQGEREINVKTGTSFTGTIPDAIVYLAIELAYKRMHNMMIFDGPNYVRDKDKMFDPIWDDDLLEIIDTYKAKSIAPIRLHRLYNNDPSITSF